MREAEVGPEGVGGRITEGPPGPSHGSAFVFRFLKFVDDVASIGFFSNGLCIVKVVRGYNQQSFE